MDTVRTTKLKKAHKRVVGSDSKKKTLWLQSVYVTLTFAIANESYKCICGIIWPYT